MKDKIEELKSIMSREPQPEDIIIWSPGGITVKQGEKINSCTLSVKSHDFSNLVKELADEHSLGLEVANSPGFRLAYKLVSKS